MENLPINEVVKSLGIISDILLKKILIFNILCMCVSMCSVCVCVQEGQKRVTDSPGAKLQVIMSFPMKLLRTKIDAL